MNAFFHLTLNQNESLTDNRLTDNIQSGISFLREGISDAIDKTGDCISHIVAPVNNFLKDITQMDREFKRVHESEHEFRICLNGQMVTAADVLNMDMEENY